MGFAFLSAYDVDACAQLCNTQDPDPVGGPCIYFNIWRAVVDGIPTTYTCSMVSTIQIVPVYYHKLNIVPVLSRCRPVHGSQ